MTTNFITVAEESLAACISNCRDLLSGVIDCYGLEFSYQNPQYVKSGDKFIAERKSGYFVFLITRGGPHVEIRYYVSHNEGENWNTTHYVYRIEFFYSDSDIFTTDIPIGNDFNVLLEVFYMAISGYLVYNLTMRCAY